MGKKKKRKKRNRNQLKDLPVSVLETNANQNLGEGKFRSAVDCYKRLCKHDREKYLPRLIEAYQGLARQMMEQGKLTDARVVLERIKELTGSYLKGDGDILLALKQGDFSSAARMALGCLSQGDMDCTPETGIIADALVLGFSEIPPSESFTPSLNAELGAIHDALRRITEEKYQEALVALRPIGMQSIFSHWKLLLKGAVAYYQGEDEKAMRAFRGLSPESFPAKAAEPYTSLLEGSNGLEKYYRNADLLKRLCWLTGEEALANVLPRAEYLWRVGRFRDSYRLVRDSLDDFPSEEPGIAHTLAVFYFNSVLQLGERQADKLLEFLYETAFSRGAKNQTEELMTQRALCLYSERESLTDLEIVQTWEDLLTTYERIHGENRKLKALVYAYMGDQFSEELGNGFSFFSLFGNRRGDDCQLRDAVLAERFYEKSLKQNPGDKEVHFSLLGVYEKTKQKAKVNRKLDEIIRLFPEDKDALVKAGVGCTTRNAFQKAMKYLTQAVELDPLDNNARECLEIACIKAGLKHAQNSKVARYRDLLKPALENGIPDSDDFNLGHPYLYVRWSCFELLNGKVEEAEELMALALKMTEKLLRLVYFSWLIARVYGVQPRYLKETQKRIKQEFSGKAEPGKTAVFADVLSYFWNFTSPEWLDEETVRVNAYARKAGRRDCSRQEAITIVQFALSERNGDLALAERYIEKMLKKNPEDPLFLFHRFQTRLTKSQFRPPGREEMEELRYIQSLAEKERDLELVAKIKKVLDLFEKAFPFFEDPDMLDDIDFEDDDFDDDDLDDWDPEDDPLHAFLDMFDLPPDPLPRSDRRVHDFDTEDEEETFPIPASRTKRKRKPRKNANGGSPEKGTQLNLFE